MKTIKAKKICYHDWEVNGCSSCGHWEAYCMKCNELKCNYKELRRHPLPRHYTKVLKKYDPHQTIK